MKAEQLDFFDRACNARSARARGSVAAQATADRAERCHPGWLQEALAALKAFAKHQHGAFSMEMAREVIAKAHPTLKKAPDLRAWGAVTQHALRLGILRRRAGAFAPAMSSNGSLKPMYERGPSIDTL